MPLNLWNSLCGFQHRLGRYLPVPLLLMGTFVLFLPSLTGGFFCWDDNIFVLAPLVQRLDFNQLILFFSTFHCGLYHPLTTLSFAIDYQIGGGSAFPYHVTNTILHLVNTCLIYLFIRRLSSAPATPFFVALLFGIHPMHVESVAWITSRKDLLYCFFLIISLLCYLSYIERLETKFYVLALLFCLFSALSKIQAAVLPLLLCLTDYLTKRKFTRNLLIEKIPFLLIIVILVIINIKAQSVYGYIDNKATYSIAERVLQFCSGFVLYLEKIIVPHPLSFFYPLHPTYSSTQSLVVLLLYPFVTLLSIAVTIMCIMKSYRDEAFGLIFFLICIVLVLFVTNFREFIIANRYTYIASTGIYYCLASAAHRVIQNNPRLPRLKWVIISAASFIIFAFSMLTFQENQLWKSPEKLLHKALQQYPENPFILTALGNILLDEGENVQAIEYLNHSISIDNKISYSFYNRGVAELHLKRYEEALKDLSRSISLGPEFLDAWFEKGNVYMNTGDFEKAMEQYSHILAKDGRYCGAWENRAIAKGQQGDFRGAMDDLENVIGICPDNGSAYYVRGLAQLELGMDGCKDLRTAQSLNHGDAAAAIQRFCE